MPSSTYAPREVPRSRRDALETDGSLRGLAGGRSRRARFLPVLWTVLHRQRLMSEAAANEVSDLGRAHFPS